MPYRQVWRSIAARLLPRRGAGSGDSTELKTLRNLLDAAPAAMVTLTRDGNVAGWNRAAERLFGWTRAEVAGGPPPYLPPDSGAAEAAVRRRVVAGNELFHRRGRFRGRDGEELDLQVSSAPQRDAAGAIIGIVSVFAEVMPAAVPAAATHAPTAARPRGEPERDRDDQPAAAPASLASPAPRAGADRGDAGNGALHERPSQFLARVSHDLRQPLHALGLLTGALERRVKEPETRELVANAGAMVRALQETFDNIVDLARLDEGQVPSNPVVMPAAEMMAPIAAEVARDAAKRGIDFRYVQCSARLRADPVLLQRLLRQLLGNALRFARRADGASGTVLLGVRRRGARLRVVVADNGFGVPADRAAQIFEPFFQLEDGRAAGGLGLGLAIAQRLARLLHSQVELRSAPGKGSMFWVDLPAAPEEEPRGEEPRGE